MSKNTPKNSKKEKDKHIKHFAIVTDEKHSVIYCILSNFLMLPH